MDWREFLTGKRARDDLFETFPPEHRSDHQPSLLGEGEWVVAARAAAKVLEVVAKRGGTRIDPAVIEALLDVLDESLPEEARHHCDDEAARILDWLEHGSTTSPEDAETGLPPELDLMLEADTDERISVIEYAIDEAIDLEFEYFEEESRTWPLLRGTPLGITEEGSDRGASVLELERRGERLEIPIPHIRWLTPVSRLETPDEPEDAGRVLEFPEERVGDGAPDPDDAEED